MTEECRLEFFNAKTGSWVVAHKGVPLLHPDRYVERLAERGKIGRVTILATGEVIQGDGADLL